MSSTLALIFIGVAVLFILGIKFLSSPKTARYGNLVAAGGMLVLAEADNGLAQALGFVAVIFGSANVFGGFMVTDRMLQMFKKKKK